MEKLYTVSKNKTKMEKPQSTKTRSETVTQIMNSLLPNSDLN